MQNYYFPVPGGMLTLENQLKEQNAIDRFDELIDEIPLVRSDMGYIPLVTPTSQIVGTQAVINVLNGERYKVVTKETSALVKGEYGKTPAEVSKMLKDLVLKGDEPITCRPADLIDKNEYKNTKDQFQKIIKSENLDIDNDDENLLIYTLFPDWSFIPKNKNNTDFFEKSPSQLNEDKEGYYKVEIDEKEYIVKFSKTAKPEIIDASAGNNVKTQTTDVNENHPAP